MFLYNPHLVVIDYLNVLEILHENQTYWTYLSEKLHGLFGTRLQQLLIPKLLYGRISMYSVLKVQSTWLRLFFRTKMQEDGILTAST